jgi:hypothetical protein
MPSLPDNVKCNRGAGRLGKLRTKQWPVPIKAHSFNRCDGGRTSGGVAAMKVDNQPVPVKRYARGKLYRPDIMTYLTREDLMAVARSGERFVVVDAQAGADVTASFLPILVEP